MCGAYFAGSMSIHLNHYPLTTGFPFYLLVLSFADVKGWLGLGGATERGTTYS